MVILVRVIIVRSRILLLGDKQIVVKYNLRILSPLIKFSRIKSNSKLVDPKCKIRMRGRLINKEI